MRKLEKIVDASLRGIGMLCLLFAVASPMLALVLWRGEILGVGLALAFMYFAFIDTANKIQEFSEAKSDVED